MCRDTGGWRKGRYLEPFRICVLGVWQELLCDALGLSMSISCTSASRFLDLTTRLIALCGSNHYVRIATSNFTSSCTGAQGYSPTGGLCCDLGSVDILRHL